MSAMDYRKLCIELFGTDDVEQLKKLAGTIKHRNERGAGRKRKFTSQDIAEIRALRAKGIPIQEIADRYATSRQVVSKYLRHPLDEGYTMRLIYMYQQTPCTIIDVDFLHQKIRIQNQTDDLLHRAFGVNEAPSWADFERFLQERCFPRTRGMLKEALADLGIDTYDPLQIAEKTKGRTSEDNMWLKFQYRNGVTA